MRKNFLKRTLAGVLSAVTLCSSMAVSVPTAFAAEEDNKASAIEIKVGENYNVADKGVSKAWFQQNGAPRNVWPMFTKASDGTEIRAYCADHAKGNPGTGGKPYTVTGQVKDMRVYGVVVKSDSRNTLNTFISGSKVLNAGNFTADMYFSASQAAIWCALGDAQIAANSKFGVTYPSSTSLGYRSSGKTLSASTTSEALTLYAAIEMLKYGNEFDGVWGSSGKGHAPWVGNTINYTPGSATYNAANAKTGSVDLPNGIVKSGIFAEKSIDGTDYLVLPMAAASATFVRSNRIFVRASNLPSGAFIMDEDGNKNGSDGLLTLTKVHSDKTLYKNGNDMAFGQVFYFCIPKTTAEQMDAANTPITTSFLTSMNVDRYNVYVASTNSSGIQPVILVEPAVKLSSNKLAFSSTTVPKDRVKLKVMKTDKDGAPLEGCTFQINYTESGKTHTDSQTTDSNGEAEFIDLPSNTTVTVKETAAPEGYTLLPSKTVNTGTKGGQTVELKLANSDDHTFKVHKISSADGRNLMGATFEVRGIDNNFKHTYTTDALGEFEIQGRDLPNGSFEVYEIAAPEGYATDGSDIQTFAWDNSKDIELSFVTTNQNGEAMVENLQPGTYRVKETGGDTEHYNMDAGEQTVELVKDQAEIPTLTFANTIKKHFGILKIDSETHKPIEGVTFAIYKDGKLLGNYTTGADGRIWLPYAEPGTYQAQEVITDPKYVLNEKVFTIENNSEYPTFFTIPNVMKKDITVTKIDKDTGKPLQGVVFQGFKDGKSIGYFTTGTDGKFTIPYADSGTYTFKEYHTLAGYVLNKEPITIEHTTDGNVDLVVDNTVQKKFEVVKVDSQTKQPLAGVQFKIWRDATLLGDYTTDENGKITIEKAPAGTYKVQEVATLKEYILNDKPYEIEHTTDKDTSLTIENTKKPGLSITKIDAETKKPLPGAVFKLTRANGDVVREDITTGEDGTAFVEGLDAADYIVTEVTAPGGYIIDKTPHAVSLEQGKTYTLTLENEKKPGLLVKKVDAQTSKPLAGASFKITRGDGSVVRENVVSDVDGVVHIPELDTGVYIITEVKAPSGYEIDETPKTVQLRKGQTYEVTFKDTKQSQLVIKKVDEDTRQPLKNAKFKITKSNGELVKETETDENGTITLTGLPDCSLVVTEIKAPDGYILQDTPKTIEVKAGGSYELTFTNKKQSGLTIKKIDEETRQPLKNAKFKITKSNGELVKEAETDVNGTITLTGLPDCSLVVTEIAAPTGYILQDTPKTIEVKAGQSYELTFTNKKAYGLQIRKVVKGTGEALAGAKFKVEKVSGERIGEYTSNSAGLVNISGLEDGIYVVTEIKAPDGYRIDTNPKNVIVKAGELATVEFENAKMSSVRIKKIDSVTKDPIPGVRFLIKDKNKNIVGEYTTDSDGYIELENDLEEGKYYAEEIQAAPGYIRDTQERTFRVKRGETTEIVWENTAQYGQIQVIKKSKDYNSINGLPAGTLLQGATFEIYDKAQNVVDTVVSNERGLAISKLLPLGRYTIKETKAPKYYGVSGETFEAEIEFASQIVRLEVLDESVYTNVVIGKSGPKQVTPGMQMKWTISRVANNSSIRLTSFYWRDNLPYQAVQLDKIVTGTYNTRIPYKVVYKTNFNQTPRTLADNLDPSVNRVLQATPTALGLKSGEAVTQIMFIFGTVPSGFRMVDNAYIYGTVRKSASGSSFVNKADVGGLNDSQQWIMSNDAWTTTIYRAPTYKKPTLPTTGW